MPAWFLVDTPKEAAFFPVLTTAKGTGATILHSCALLLAQQISLAMQLTYPTRSLRHGRDRAGKAYPLEVFLPGTEGEQTQTL